MHRLEVMVEELASCIKPAPPHRTPHPIHAMQDGGTVEDQDVLEDGDQTPPEWAVGEAWDALLEALPPPASQRAAIAACPHAPALAHAAFVLACLHAAGLAELVDVRPDTQPFRAVAWLHTAAAAGHQGATRALADRYLTGRGVPRSLEEGLHRARTAADALVRVSSRRLHMELPMEPVRLRARFLGHAYPSAVDREWEDHEALRFDVDDALACVPVS